MADSGFIISVMNRKLKIASALTLSFIASTGASGSSPTSTPDFAFPKKVSEQSLTSLKKSISSHDSQGIVRSVLDYSLAQSAVGKEKMVDAFHVIDNTLKEVNEPASKSLLYLIKAKMLCEIYTDDKYNFNTRKLPLHPLPADYTEWSGKQFQYVISQLCDSALLPQSTLQAIPLKNYYRVVNHDNLTQVYFPSLYDFVAYQTIDIRSDLTDFSNMFAAIYLSPARSFILEPHFVPMSSEATKILDTYANILKFHSGSPAPYIFADLQRLNFVNNGLYHSYDDDNNHRQFVNSLKSLYSEYETSEYSGNILIDLDDISDGDIELSKWLYSKAKQNLEAFPLFNRNNCLKNIVKSLSAPTVDLSYVNNIYPGKEFDIRITNRNCSDFTVSLYQLPPKFTGDYSYSGSLSELKLIDKKSVSTHEAVPFLKHQKVSFTVQEPGYYIIAANSAEIKNEHKRNQNYNIIHCSRLTSGNFNLDKTTIYVIDPMTGAPVDGALLMQYNRNKALLKLGTTDAEGFYSFTPKSYANIYPQKDSDIYASSIYAGPINNNAIYNDSAINAFTELPLYHPGDTVKFAVIAYGIAGNSHKTLANKNITANIFDANNQLVDTIALITDAFGRAAAKCKLPESGLTGRYNIALCFGNNKLDSYWGKKSGSISFMVSDYKMPTFEITANPVLNDAPQKGDVTVSGMIRTYSGMPLAGQEVTVEVSVAQNYWWRMSNAVNFFTDTVTSDENGKWEIVLSKQVLDYSPAPNGYFNATVKCTSPSGESQQSSISFTRGDKYIINASVPADLNVENPVDLNVKVTDSANKPVNIPVHYELSVADSIVHKGLIKPDMDWKRFSGNQYFIKLWLEQDSTTNLTQTIVLYTPSDKNSPVKQPMWMPEQNSPFVTDSDKCRLLYAVSEDDTYVLLTVSTPEKILERKWIKANHGMHYLEINLPVGINRVEVVVQATKSMLTSQFNRTVVRKSSLKSLNIKAESFRNKMIPGTTETWTFRTLNIDSKGEQSAVILNLYNSALNALQAPSWSLNPRTSYVRFLSMSTPSLNGMSFENLAQRTSYYSCPDLFAPGFNLYSRSFTQPKYLLYSMARSSVKASAIGNSNAYVMEDAMEMTTMEEKDVEEMPAMAKGIATEADAGSALPQKPDAQEFSYRENNVTCGLWMPSLTTDTDGNLSISFTVPNANTTWQLFATAFNKDLINSTLSELVVANKPIMVQPNLPRYLRTGDKAILKSLVMNNSDSVADILTTIEIFNPVTNKVLYSSQQTTSVLPQQNATVSINVEAPVDEPMIGFRVKSSANGFADGEQTIIPILPASQHVIESTTFYIAPDSTSFSIKLPEMPEDARVTLQYCDNPLWYVVTALPGLAEAQPRSAINAAYNIFSASVAKGILKDNPSIAKALEYWTNHSSDSTLVSMLEKNADLKTVLLNSTPWLADAKNDTERMSRLALLLDNKNIDATINSGIKYLKKVQRGNGFAWMDQCDEASLWATSEVLACLGRANQLGYMPDNKELLSMTNSALEYVQTQNEKIYAKYPKSDYFAYVSMLDLWPSFHRSAVSQKITSLTVQRTLKNWRNYTVGHKAEAVILLMNHNYKTVAATILNSLRQYSEYKPQSGMWWPSVGDVYGGSMSQLQITADALEAFHAVQPTAKDVDRIRQWLILQKEAENWGNSAFTSDVIYSILLTSKSWLEPAGTVDIRLDDNSVDIPTANKFTGYFRTSLNNASNSTLTVNRNGKSPAFGAVLCQFTQDMNNIQAKNSDAVSIEKRYYKYQGTDVVNPDSIKIGDKIQVSLTIHVNRDMQYVAITDNRPACLEPVEQMPQPLYRDGLCFYRENRDSATNLFVTNMPRGTYQLKYDMWVNNAGLFASGIATLQSQYAPQLTAHSAGQIMVVGQ